MSCVDCFNGCDDTLTSDRCIKYTGDPIASLSICTGDQLSFIESALLIAVVGFQTGDGIGISGITGCASLTALFDTPPTLKGVIQGLATSYCSLKSIVTSVQASLNSSYSFDIQCLTGLTSISSRDQILQSSINSICTINTSVNAILADYVKNSDLNTLIANYLDSINTTTVIQYNVKSVPYIAYEYYGPLTNFDSTGKGLISTGFDKMYICNGLNGTPDKRGRTSVGAVAGVPGGSLDSAVDPSLPANAGTNYNLKDKFGSSNIVLSVLQIPAHGHGITDPGHMHNLNPDAGSQQVHRSGDTGHALRTEDFSTSATTTINPTGISILSTGGSQPHSNVQPSIAANFIMFLP